MEFEQVFDNLTFKHMDALWKKIQSLINYVLNPVAAGKENIWWGNFGKIVGA